MRATGFACDICKVFATAKDERSVPVGWMTLTVSVPDATRANSSINTVLHICSNRCLRDLGTARWRAEKDVGETAATNGLVSQQPVTSSGRQYSDEARAKFRQNGMRIQHGKGNHAEANPQCEICQQELGMTAEEIAELIKQGQ